MHICHSTFFIGTHGTFKLKEDVFDRASGESVFDIACRDVSQPDPLNHRFADDGATDDLNILLFDSEKVHAS